MNNPKIIDRDNWKNPLITKKENNSYHILDSINYVKYDREPIMYFSNNEIRGEYMFAISTSVTEGVPGFQYLSLLTQLHKSIDKFREEFLEISDEIEQSHNIFALSDDWDDNGALVIPTNILVEATQFLKRYALYILDRYNVKIATPSINPVKDGTIDLEWHTPNARFLINFKNNQVASYYGDNNNNLNSIKGRVNVLDIEDYLAAWMTKLKQ